MRAYDRPDLVKTSEKGINDYVTNVDKEAEDIIVHTLKKTYPDHGFITEETGTLGNPDSEYQWVIDPIDGTLNFSRGIPHFSISIACEHKGRVLSCVILDPVRQEEFIASSGEGAFLNRTRMRVSNKDKLESALLGYGGNLYGGNLGEAAYKSQTQLMNQLIEKRCVLREAGSACLDLAYVAAGRYDGLWMHGLKHWDMAAGLLLVAEAGGLVGDFEGGGRHLQSGNIIAAPAKVFKALTPLVKKAF